MTTPITPIRTRLSSLDDVRAGTADGSGLLGITPAQTGSVSAKAANIVFAIGDSVTSQGNNPITAPGQTFGAITRLSYLMHAVLASGGTLTYGGVAATYGYTTTQILATHLPTALAVKPDFCVVLGGYNDAPNAVPLATTKSNLSAIYAALVAAGVVPVLCGLGPKVEYLSTPSVLLQLNQWIERQARLNGWPYVDMFSQLANPFTGGFLPGVNMDTVHQEGTGRHLMGQAIWHAMASRVKPWRPYLSPTDTDDMNLIGHPLFGGTPGAHGVPPSWSTDYGTVTDGATYQYVVDPLCPGYMLQITQGTGPANTISTAGYAVNPGDHIHFGCKLGGNVMASNGAFNVQLAGVTSGMVLFAVSQWNQDAAVSTIASEIIIPSGWAEQIAVTIQTTAGSSGTGAGASVRVGQMTLLNLTQQGLL